MLRRGDQARPDLDVDDLRLARRLERPHRTDRRQRRIVAERGNAGNADQRLATDASGAVELPGGLDAANRPLNRPELLQALVRKRDSARDCKSLTCLPGRASPERSPFDVQLGRDVESAVGVLRIVANSAHEQVPRPPPWRPVVGHDEIGETARVAVREVEPDEDSLAGRNELLEQLMNALRGLLPRARIFRRRTVATEPDAVRADPRGAPCAPVDRDVGVEDVHRRTSSTLTIGSWRVSRAATGSRRDGSSPARIRTRATGSRGFATWVSRSSSTSPSRASTDPRATTHGSVERSASFASRYGTPPDEVIEAIGRLRAETDTADWPSPESEEQCKLVETWREE